MFCTSVKSTSLTSPKICDMITVPVYKIHFLMGLLTVK